MCAADNNYFWKAQRTWILHEGCSMAQSMIPLKDQDPYAHSEYGYNILVLFSYRC